MKELERQQKEQEQNADRVFDMQTEQGIAPRSRYNLSPAVQTVTRNNVVSRRSSEDSMEATSAEEGGRNHRDIRYELKVSIGDKEIVCHYNHRPSLSTGPRRPFPEGNDYERANG